jgi:hypothetical protein
MQNQGVHGRPKAAVTLGLLPRKTLGPTIQPSDHTLNCEEPDLSREERVFSVP